jgi:CubicO group peptidase (beta-lactamase class C family)
MSRHRFAVVRLLALYASTIVVAVPLARGADEEIAAKLAALMEDRARDGRFSGAVLVARDGVPLLRRGYGMANRELDVPNTRETKFRIGSLTKQFTAAAVMILQQQGKLRVEATIKTYLPHAPPAWDEITVHHLLTHTSGIQDYTGLPDYERTVREPTTPDSLIARFRDQPLEFKPGEGFGYSNSGYAVLGRIIERVSGQSYAQFLQDQVFEPLEMNDSGYDDARSVLKDRAAGYVEQAAGMENARFIDMTIPYAAGGLYSTVDDLLKWDGALASSRLLSPESKKAMFTPVRELFGYGWRIARVFDRPMVAHPGSVNGFASHIRRFPEDGVVVIVLSNVAGTRVVELGHELAAVVFGKGSDTPSTRRGG